MSNELIAMYLMIGCGSFIGLADKGKEFSARVLQISAILFWPMYWSWFITEILFFGVGSLEKYLRIKD